LTTKPDAVVVGAGVVVGGTVLLGSVLMGRELTGKMPDRAARLEEASTEITPPLDITHRDLRD
jgi:hypothetical protein